MIIHLIHIKNKVIFASFVNNITRLVIFIAKFILYNENIRGNFEAH